MLAPPLYNIGELVKYRSVGCDVILPIELDITEQRAIRLTDQIHDAFEDILKEFFDESR